MSSFYKRFLVSLLCGLLCAGVAFFIVNFLPAKWDGEAVIRSAILYGEPIESNTEIITRFRSPVAIRFVLTRLDRPYDKKNIKLLQQSTNLFSLSAGVVHIRIRDNDADSTLKIIKAYFDFFAEQQAKITTGLHSMPSVTNFSSKEKISGDLFFARGKETVKAETSFAVEPGALPYPVSPSRALLTALAFFMGVGLVGAFYLFPIRRQQLAR